MSAQAESKNIARRYVKALFDLARDAKSLETVEKDMLGLHKLLDTDQAFTQFIHSPLIDRTTKGETLGAIAKEGRASELTQRFLKVLAQNQRLDVLPEVISQFGEMLAESRGEVTAEVTSAEPLAKDQISAISAALKKATGKDVNIKTKENPAILGGLIVKVGGRMLDGSVAGKLERLKQALRKQA